MLDAKRRKEIEHRIGYTFHNPALLEKALTHSSYSNEHRLGKLNNNERLEFLGDAVLEVVSSEFLYKCWKRFRKYYATLTGITQNVEEYLLSDTARLMFANSAFLVLLNQAPTDRAELAKLLDASDAQMDYVSDAPAGHGLIKVGSCLVPFINELPRDTELYRLMTTKPGEQNA